jgi:stage II sporulation protein AA (anti-sigma F factor antagonist)
VNRSRAGQEQGVEDSTSAAPRDAGETVPEVTSGLDDGAARIAVTGELTDAARRPLVRVVTDLLLGEPSLRRIELDMSGVTFMNSAGMAVLVQLQRLGRPRDVPVVLVAPPPAVIRPLQLAGLWHRFPVVDPPVQDGAG